MELSIYVNGRRWRVSDYYCEIFEAYYPATAISSSYCDKFDKKYEFRVFAFAKMAVLFSRRSDESGSLLSDYSSSSSGVGGGGGGVTVCWFLLFWFM